jgi:DNA-directed RNA polymerase II subunit RPB1
MVGNSSGDECNGHMAQNIQAEIELKQLCNTPSQIVSPSSNKPINGVKQDNLLGSYRFTRANIQLKPEKVMNYLMKTQKINTSIFEKRKTITNFEILSQIMPPLSLKYETDLFDQKEDKQISNNILEIENGEYLRGQMDVNVLMSGSKGIIHRVFNDYGPETAATFIDNLQNIITEYMKDVAYSVGINDLIANKRTYDEIDEVIKNQKNEVKQLIDQIHLGIYKNESGDKNIEDFELRVNNILNKATEETGKIGFKSLSPNNRFLMIVKSGSKGKKINLSQMICCLGQQNVDGRRVPYGFDNRTLPHFQKYDDSPVSRGFVENSYISGLTATDLFFHAMCGRIGLIDTAVKTSATGYIQRRIIKGLEDLKVEYDMTVRNSFGKIIQFAYGENGFDPTKDENQSIPLVSMTIEEIYQHYNIGEDEMTKHIYTKDALKRAKEEIVEFKSKAKQYIEMMIDSRKTLIEDVFRFKDDSGIKAPIHIERTIQTIQGNLNINANSLVDITPLEVFKMVEEMFHRIETIFTFMPMNTPWRILYYYYLSPKYLLQKRRFNRHGVQLLLEKILLKWKQSMIAPGEMVGVIAGQSIGEPTTQMTLNSFHTSSGTASKGNVLGGVPRVEELLRLTKNPKTPSLTIYLKPEDRYDQMRAQNVANMIEYTRLADLVISSQICFDPKEDATVIPEDEILLKEFYKYEQIIYNAAGVKPNNNTTGKSKWIVRLEFDPKILLDKNITMNDIHFAITNSAYGNDNNLTCVYSDFNSDKLIFRIRIGASLFQKQAKRANKSIVPLDDQDDINLLKSYQNALLNNIVLRGIPGVNNVIPRKLKNTLILEDGNYVKKNTWILDTSGTNLMDVLALDYIDVNNTYTNDVREVFDVLGVFAARQVLYEEFVNVMTPTYINYHHLSLLCDRIMSTKDLVPIFRTGIQNDNIGPIAKATFETHTEELLKASKHGELDPVKGVSANIMMGQLGFFGTNSFELLFDTEQLKNLKAIDTPVTDDDDDESNPFSELLPQNKKMSPECEKTNINIVNGINKLTLNGPQPDNINNRCIMEDEYEENLGF